MQRGEPLKQNVDREIIKAMFAAKPVRDNIGEYLYGKFKINFDIHKYFIRLFSINDKKYSFRMEKLS